MDKTPKRHVSVLVCAFNEEKTIGSKIENVLAVDKNNHVIEIIIIDDNSSDRTHEIVTSYAKLNNKVKAVKNKHKKGKWGALFTGFQHAQGEFICVTDADAIFQDGTFKNVLTLFDNHLIGGVTIKQKIVSAKNGIRSAPSMGFYTGVRNFLRKIESLIDSTILMYGQGMFIRKSCLSLPEDGPMADDIYIAILIRKNGYKVVLCDKAYFIEEIPLLPSKNSRKIFKRRAKALAHIIITNRDLLFNPKYKKFGFICFPLQFFLHVVFPFLIIPTEAGLIFWLAYYRHFFLLAILIGLSIVSYKLFMMAWFQMISVINHIFRANKYEAQWETLR